MKTPLSDILVIGAGPAGGMAALEAARRGLAVTVVADGPVGGLVWAARRIDNIPCWPEGISGRQWAANFTNQLAAKGITPIAGRVARIERLSDRFMAITTGAEYHARCVVVATGTRPVTCRPAIPESPLVHRDVSTMPADIPGCRVAIIGSGEAAIDSALTMLDLGAHVTIFARGDRLSGCPGLLNELEASSAALVVNAELRSAWTTTRSVHLEFRHCRGWQGDHVVVAIGRESRIDEIDMAGVGDAPGIFFAGDMLRNRDRYLALALGDGQNAACLAHRYIMKRSLQ